MIYKTLHRKLKIEQQELTKDRVNLRCSGRVGSSSSTRGTRHVTLVTNPMEHKIPEKKQSVTNSFFLWNCIIKLTMHNVHTREIISSWRSMSNTSDGKTLLHGTVQSRLPTKFVKYKRKAKIDRTIGDWVK